MRCASGPVAIVLLLAGAALASSAPPEPVAVYAHRYAMGTMFDVVAYHAQPELARRAAAHALAEVERLDAVMSHYKADSELSRLVAGRHGEFVDVSRDLYDVLARSQEISRQTDGTFDTTVGPLVKLWRRAEADGRLPTNAELAAARRCVGYQHVELRAPGSVRLGSPCMELDLGGIGKGFAVDRALAILARDGVRDAIVNAGSSSIASIGAPPGRRGWPVELDAPLDGKSVLLLRDRSLSTSQQDASPIAHGGILDPATGARTRNRTAVTVLAPDATTADALSTTLVLMSVDRGREVLDRFPGVAAIWADGEGGLLASARTSLLDLAER